MTYNTFGHKLILIIILCIMVVLSFSEISLTNKQSTLPQAYASRMINIQPSLADIVPIFDHDKVLLELPVLPSIVLPKELPNTGWYSHAACVSKK